MGSSQAPALARKAGDHLSSSGSMTIVLPYHRSRTRVPRGSRQSPTKRTARLLPTLKTTVSPLIGVKTSKEDILTRVMDGLKPPPFAGPAGTGQQSFLQRLALSLLLCPLAAGDPNSAVTRSWIQVG